MMIFFRILFSVAVLVVTIAASYSLLRPKPFSTIYSEHDGRRINK